MKIMQKLLLATALCLPVLPILSSDNGGGSWKKLKFFGLVAASAAVVGGYAYKLYRNYIKDHCDVCGEQIKFNKPTEKTSQSNENATNGAQKKLFNKNTINDIQKKLFIEAVCKGDLFALKKLIKEDGFNINTQVSLPFKIPYRPTSLLIEAIYSNQVDTVKWLLANGAELGNFTDKTDQAIIHGSIGRSLNGLNGHRVLIAYKGLLNGVTHSLVITKNEKRTIWSFDYCVISRLTRSYAEEYHLYSLGTLLYTALDLDEATAAHDTKRVIQLLLECSDADRRCLTQRYQTYLRNHPTPEVAMMLAHYGNSTEYRDLHTATLAKKKNIGSDVARNIMELCGYFKQPQQPITIQNEELDQDEQEKYNDAQKNVEQEQKDREEHKSQALTQEDESSDQE